MNSPVHIGTSGWSYRHWKGLFYPPKLASVQWLSFYARHFSTTEINGSFYRLPSQGTVLKWVEQVPEDFKFCPKMSRFLTHLKKLKQPEEPLGRFFGVFEGMKAKMGPVLIQLPPILNFDYDTADYFFQLLKYEYRDYEFVLEVRHQTWLEEKSLTLMTNYNIGFVISQSGAGFPYSEIITANNIYVRFHGPAQLYASSYSDEMLSDFTHKFRRWIREGHTIWAYFNNDVGGYALEDAQRLKETMIKNKEQ